ncbi:AbrB/MazE/SpoVT family DNA-binding domain-containing protein [Sphingomonas tabacisoli]|uniref:AbrB/MazE/SpoVT family DNA-binding domain-containing protein n=1 Tax=Sphingomonas tabacisoli TaxID=2249466 RepID=A0ABW4HZI0_9SPHN
MGKEYPAKTFKSGNSIALRLPKALGIKEGMEMKVREEDGNLIVAPADRPKRKFNIDKVWGIGKHLGLKPIAPEDRVFEHRPLLWEDPDWMAAYKKGQF